MCSESTNAAQPAKQHCKKSYSLTNVTVQASLNASVSNKGSTLSILTSELGLFLHKANLYCIHKDTMCSTVQPVCLLPSVAMLLWFSSKDDVTKVCPLQLVPNCWNCSTAINRVHRSCCQDRGVLNATSVSLLHAMNLLKFCMSSTMWVAV